MSTRTLYTLTTKELAFKDIDDMHTPDRPPTMTLHCSHSKVVACVLIVHHSYQNLSKSLHPVMILMNVIVAMSRVSAFCVETQLFCAEA